jgi:hypothetical protein
MNRFLIVALGASSRDRRWSATIGALAVATEASEEIFSGETADQGSGLHPSVHHSTTILARTSLGLA